MQLEASDCSKAVGLAAYFFSHSLCPAPLASLLPNQLSLELPMRQSTRM